MIRTQPERHQVMVGRHIKDNLYTIERMGYDGVALFAFYPPELPVHLCACPTRKKEPTLTEKAFNWLRKRGWV